MSQHKLYNGKMVKNMDKEPILINGLYHDMLENIKMAYTTDMEPTHGQMEKSTLENGNMMENMAKELLRGQTERYILVNGLIVENTDEVL